MLDLNIRTRITKLALYFSGMVTTHVVAMYYFENLSIPDAIWMTLTTVTTVGYGDITAQTEIGRISTVILLYFGGIFILAKIAGDYFDYRLERRERMLKGQWRWKMQDHILIINTPTHNAVQYFDRLVTQFRAHEDFKETPIQLLTPAYPEGLHPSMQKLGIIHYSAMATTPGSLEAVDASGASQIVILAIDETDSLSDSMTFDVLHRLREKNKTANITVECVDDNNRSRFYTAGANSVIRPIRAYPELIVRSIVAPGCELVLENLFTHGGNHTRRYDVTIHNIKWANIVCALINHNLGTALAYLDENGHVITDPNPVDNINASGIILLIREQHIPDDNEIIEAVKKCQA